MNELNLTLEALIRSGKTVESTPGHHLVRLDDLNEPEKGVFIKAGIEGQFGPDIKAALTAQSDLKNVTIEFQMKMVFK